MANNNQNSNVLDNSPEGQAARALSYAKREVPGIMKVMSALGCEKSYDEILDANFAIKLELVRNKVAEVSGAIKSDAERIAAALVK